MPPIGYATASNPKIVPKFGPPNTSLKAADRTAIVAPLPRPCTAIPKNAIAGFEPTSPIAATTPPATIAAATGV